MVSVLVTMVDVQGVVVRHGRNMILLVLSGPSRCSSYRRWLMTPKLSTVVLVTIPCKGSQRGYGNRSVVTTTLCVCTSSSLGSASFKHASCAAASYRISAAPWSGRGDNVHVRAAASYRISAASWSGRGDNVHVRTWLFPSTRRCALFGSFRASMPSRDC